MLAALFLATTFLMPAVFLQVSLAGRFAAVLRVGAVLRFVRRSPGNFVEAWLVSIEATTIAAALGPAAPWGIFWSYLVIVCTFNEALYRSGTPDVTSRFARSRFARRVSPALLYVLCGSLHSLLSTLDRQLSSPAQSSALSTFLPLSCDPNQGRRAVIDPPMRHLTRGRLECPSCRICRACRPIRTIGAVRGAAVLSARATRRGRRPAPFRRHTFQGLGGLRASVLSRSRQHGHCGRMALRSWNREHDRSGSTQRHCVASAVAAQA